MLGTAGYGFESHLWVITEGYNDNRVAQLARAADFILSVYQAKEVPN